MPISFTKTVVSNLNKEIAEVHNTIINEKKKEEKALSKINQLQRDMKLSTSAHDLSSKMSRINKLNEDIKQIQSLQTVLSTQLANKKAKLIQQLPKDQQSEVENNEYD
ncbi:hypothetical protein [Paenibacillus crassostreae]|uniref:Uncharacterized protein n=1 Tax=Paenibacillus crassostreae TaxID=1763538 RepID=A0A162KNN2_9BACL|nr:hypothetical protein [Paenibacillus crassostreae]AOZ93699.1 hypothetical protein LPB68_16860 [Paenibacillus crassostreae]OAB71393.1 hypothetical protein PNBC_19730 [Paenibacillus crassostreae]